MTPKKSRAKASRYSLDPALLWAKEKYLGVDVIGPRDQVKRDLKRALFLIVDGLLKETDQTIPFKPELLFPMRRIQRIVEVDLSGIDAMLIPEIGGFCLKVGSKLHSFQKRFACAHEVGHTFFFNINTDPPRREYQSQKSSYWVEEEYSCAIAREILLPRYAVEDTIYENKIAPSMSAIKYLSSLFQVSFDVIRTKVVNDVPLWDCIVFRSSVRDGEVITKGRDISKGKSFRDIRVPLIMSRNSKHRELYDLVYSTLRKEHSKSEVKLDGRILSIETVLLNYAQPFVMSILK